MGGKGSKKLRRTAVTKEYCGQPESIQLRPLNPNNSIKMAVESMDLTTEDNTTIETISRSKKGSTINSKVAFDDYPVYNPVDNNNFNSGKSSQIGCYPIDSHKRNIGIAGSPGSGKSALINALRGLNFGERDAAGRYSCQKMESFHFVEKKFSNIVLWEIPYPQTFSNVADVYDRNMGFDRFYETNKLYLFEMIIVLVSNGTLGNDDVAFSRIIHSRRTPLVFLKIKADDDLDAEARETDQEIGDKLKERYIEKAGHIFGNVILQKAQVLNDVQLLYITSWVVHDIVCGTRTSLLYKIDEDKLIAMLGLHPGCHQELRESMQKQALVYGSRTTLSERYGTTGGKSPISLRRIHPETQPLPTVLADAGFEISYGTDDRIYGTFETKCSVRRAGKTSFNYGFAGDSGVGKSALINGIRGMSRKHPLAAGRTRTKPGTCQRFEFDDDLLAYSVTLWEVHYPKKISNFFEFIDQYQLANFTALFIVINGAPTEQDLTFAKIAFRRNATIVFLNSKCDKILMDRSRSEEIPIGDLVKQRIVDKGYIKFERILSTKAPELRGRVHLFFVSAPVFKSMRTIDIDYQVFLLHERAVFDFLKQKRIVAEILESSQSDYKEGLYASVNDDIQTTSVDELEPLT